MGLSRFAFLVTSGLLMAGAAEVLAQPLSMPPRKAGQWELSMTGMGPEGGAMTTTICVDPTTERSFSPGFMGHGGPGAAERRCTKEDYHPVPGGWAFSTECPSRQGVVVATGTVTGDFRTHLHMVMDMKDGRGSHHMMTDQRWIGPSCAAAGRTMTLPDGRVITIPAH